MGALDLKNNKQPNLHNYEFEKDPIPTLKWLQANDPVHWSQHGYWFITRHDDVKMVLGDAKTFSSRNAGFGANNPIGKSSDKSSDKTTSSAANEEKSVSRSLSVSFNQQDQPDHARIRKLVVKAFSRKEISERGDRINTVSLALLNDAKQKGTFDLVRDFAFHLPIMIASEIIGIPSDERAKFRQAFEHIERLMAPKKSDEAWKESLEQSKWLGRFVKNLIEARRVSPQEDLISALIEVSENEEQLDGREIISAIMTIFTAAGTTTERLISSGVYLLLSHPDQLAELRADHSLLDSALEEILRYHHPNQSTSTNRRATRDVELRGKTIREGDTIRVSLGAANRDGDFFENSDTFDIHRADNKHRAFGFGVHSCLGASLARAEARSALEVLLLGDQPLVLVTNNPVADPDRPDRYQEVLVRFANIRQ